MNLLYRIFYRSKKPYHERNGIDIERSFLYEDMTGESKEEEIKVAARKELIKLRGQNPTFIEITKVELLEPSEIEKKLKSILVANGTTVESV